MEAWVHPDRIRVRDRFIWQPGYIRSELGLRTYFGTTMHSSPEFIYRNRGRELFYFRNMATVSW